MQNKQQFVDIMDIPFLNMIKTDFLQQKLYLHLKNDEKCFVVTANPEIVMHTHDNLSYKKCVQQADYVVPDGMGILLAARLKHQPLRERVTGYDITMDLLDHANDEELSCYFLGASEVVNNTAVQVISEKYPNIKIAGHHHGFFAADDRSIANQIKQKRPDIVFVALGMPRQEKWIAEHLHLFDKGVFIGIGGSLDVIAGKVNRAPDIWIKLNLEWLYRLMKQPSRLGRMLKIVKFMGRIIVKK